MKVAILGAGAMGSLVGAHIKKGGGEVYFVDIYKEHMDRIREKGITMELETDTGIQVETVLVDGAVTSAETIGACDAVIVLVKCVDSDAAVEMNQALFGKDTVVITLQNGVGGADILARHFDNDHLGLGVLKSSANILGPGRIMGRARFPNSPKGVYFSPINFKTPYINVYYELEKLLTAGGMPAECNERTEEFVWDKLVTNVMINGIAALLQLSGEDVGSHEDGRILQNELGREACEVANAKGIKLDYSHYVHNRPNSEPFDRSKVKVFHYVSAVFDSYNKRRTEMDFLCGAIVKEGQKYGVKTPYNEAVWRLVRLMQDNYDNKYKPLED